MLTPDQITALAPDAASLKAGQGLATPRKWQSTGGDAEALWGLAMGSGKEPYQTRVALADFATKCSCPSRKFPCKHALGLMLIACNQPAALTEAAQPAWVREWLDSRAAREEKAVVRAQEKAAKPVDEKAAAKRRAQRDNRVNEGVALLQQSLQDLIREGLASTAARQPATWENLARRMIDSQAPGLAGNLRHIADQILRHPAVDQELPLEMGRLALLTHVCATADSQDEATRAEIAIQLGGRSSGEDEGETVSDDWLVAARTVEERDRLITSATWLFGRTSFRWARILRFAPVPQTIAEPWPVGATAPLIIRFQNGLHPQRGTAGDNGPVRIDSLPVPEEGGLESLLQRHAAALAANPFLRSLPFLLPLRPVADNALLVDGQDRSLPWEAPAETALRVDCICGGELTMACGEWNGRVLRLLAIQDDSQWIPLTSQQA